MRAAFVLAAAVGASAASVDTTFLFARQAAIAGCEDQCNPVMDWAYTCRTDINKCMEQCDAELLATSDQCVECMQTTNPEEATKIQARVDPIRQMCGGEAEDASASPAASSDAAAPSGSPAASADAAAASGSAAAASDAAAPSGSAAASSGAAAPSGSGSAAAPSGSAPASGSAANPSASAPAASPTSGAGKLSLSLGAVGAAVVAYLL